MAPAKPRAGSRITAAARNAKTAGGSAKNGTAAGKNGTARNGTAKNGTAKNGTAKNGTAKNGASDAAAPAPAKAARAVTPVRAKSGADAARPVGSGATARKATSNRAGATRTGPARTGPARTGPARTGPARTGPARTGAASATLSRAGVSEPEPAETNYAFPAAWLRWTTLALALIGLGVSIYLTYAHYTESALAGCTETTGVVNCGKVTTSQQSVVFGIPVAVFGLAFYVFMVAIMSPWAWKARRREVGLLRLASLIVGIGFVLYLIYAELFDIGSICLYCTSVHVITFFLFVLTGLAAAIWGFAPRAQPRESQPSR